MTENIPAENAEQGATLGNTEETLSVEKTVEESSLETGEKPANNKADAAASMTAEPREDNAATRKTPKTILTKATKKKAPDSPTWG